MRSSSFLSGRVRSRCAGAVLAAALAVTTGCSSYERKSQEMVTAYRDGQIAKAVELSKELAGTLDKPGKTLDEQSKVAGRDRLLYRAEQAAVLRLAGDVRGSNLALQHANEMVEKFDSEAKVKLVQEATALMTNQNMGEYRGQSYDRVMIPVYRALNFLEAGQVDKARPELNLLDLRQQENITRWRDKIEERRKAIEAEAKKKGDVNQTLNHPDSKARLSQAYGFLDQMAGQERYFNAFGEWLYGAYFLHAGNDMGDFERGRKAFERVTGVLPGNPSVQADFQAATAAAGGAKRPSNLTYVIFETGVAPHRKEIRIDLPIFLINLAVTDTGVDYVGIAFPILEKNGDYVSSLGVETPNGTQPTLTVTDMDRLIARAFKDELPEIWTKTIASAIAKAAAAYAANKATENTDAWINIATRIGTTLYQVATNEADLRTWRTLPKQIQVLRIDTPADRTVRLRTPQGTSLPPITLIPGEVNVVYVKSTSTIAPFVVRQFKFR